jgi:diacylglycerol kinase (ATP)
VARNLRLLVNPAADRGRGARDLDRVAARLRDAGFTVEAVMTRDPEEAADLSRSAAAAGTDVLVVAGGDGTIHLCLQALAGSDTTLGILPTGTGNDVARSLGIPRKDPIAAADVIIASHERRIDLARVGSHLYATVLAAGFDSLVNERANTMSWPGGQMRYNIATLAELRVFEPLRYTLEIDGARRELAAMLVAVGNGPCYGGGLRMTEGALLDDGLLDVVIIKPLGRLELVRVYPRLFKGTHVTHPQYERHRARTVSIAAPGVVAYADGERIGPLPVTVEIVPRALRVYAPPTATTGTQGRSLDV